MSSILIGSGSPSGGRPAGGGGGGGQAAAGSTQPRAKLDFPGAVALSQQRGSTKVVRSKWSPCRCISWAHTRGASQGTSRLLTHVRTYGCTKRRDERHARERNKCGTRTHTHMSHCVRIATMAMAAPHFLPLPLRAWAALPSLSQTRNGREKTMTRNPP